jgi:hypothetical protein
MRRGERRHIQETNDNVDVIPGPPPIMSSEKSIVGINSTSSHGSGKRSLIARVLVLQETQGKDQQYR